MAKDLRVTVRLGLSLPTGGAGDAWIKPEVGLTNIDPAGDVAAQVEEGLAAASLGFIEIDGKLASALDRIIESVQLVRPAEVQRVDILERRVASVTQGFNDLVVRLRDKATTEAVTAAVEGEAAP
jgi:hypothetical protein